MKSLNPLLIAALTLLAICTVGTLILLFFYHQLLLLAAMVVAIIIMLGGGFLISFGLYRKQAVKPIDYTNFLIVRGFIVTLIGLTLFISSFYLRQLLAPHIKSPSNIEQTDK